MTATASTRGFWLLRDIPTVAWLAAAGAVALVHPLVPAPRWLMLHLLLLGALGHAILVWSRHFADALLRTPAGDHDRRDQNVRLLLLNGGTAAVVTGVPGDWWGIVVAGALAVAGAVGWHGLDLLRRVRRALAARFAHVVRYYVAATAFLPVGATLGVLLARGLADPLDTRLRLAHAAVNLLGWVGLTFAGTIVTLWPTVLRTRMVPGAEAATRRALPVLLLGILGTALAAWLGPPVVVAGALAVYLSGLVLVATPFVRTGWQRRPESYASWSLLAGFAWLLGTLAVLAVAVALSATWERVSARVTWAAPLLAVGFGAQILLGALSHLVPVARGGGPARVRATAAEMDRAAGLRLALVNGGLVVAAAPVPSLVRVAATVLVLAGLAAFLPLLVRGLRAGRRAAGATSAPGDVTVADAAPPPARRTAVVGLAVVVLAVAAAAAADPAALAVRTAATNGAASGVTDAPTRTVAVEARDMRFFPSEVTVPAGTRLVIDLVNTDDSEVHDLVLAGGMGTARLAPGESATLDAGVVTTELDGWCSVVGHRQMGMVFTVHVEGEAAAPAAPTPEDNHPAGHATDRPMGEFDPDFVARDAVLPALGEDTVHELTLTVREQQQEVAPGIVQTLWTYNGTAPGPILHGRVGDVFEITLVNDGTIGHSIDFHAGALAPDRPMRTIAPGESLVYRFTATRAGIWMYHCSTMPMSAHIANGMFGAVIIEPPDLPPVDRSYVLVQSEFYLGADGGEVDVDKVAAERPDLVVFNGYADQYDARPLPARVGERVRVWVLDAGPNRPTSFHVVGGQFDTTWAEGAYLLRSDDGGTGGSQTLALAAAQGGFVELAFPEAGHYPFVSHVMVDAERGARGVFEVSP